MQDHAAGGGVGGGVLKPHHLQGHFAKLLENRII